MENMNRVNIIKTGVINEKQLNWNDLKSAFVAYNLRFSAYTQNIRTVFMVLLLTTAVSASENQTKTVKSGQNITLSARKNITVESGHNVNLTCRAPNNISVIEWSRADLGEEYVLLYRDGHFEQVNQHPSFKNRVDLQDRQMKDGDVSLILKDVMINDTGTYECRVAQKEPNQEISSLKLITIIYLHVDPPGQTRGSVGLIVGLIAAAVVLVAAVAGFLICRKHKQP